MNSHKRQGSSGSFNGHEQNHLSQSFASLERFMLVTKLMQDEIMVPSKLKDNTFKNYESFVLDHVQNQVPSKNEETVVENKENETSVRQPPESSDVLDHYKFILLIRDQFLKPKPFKQSEEDKHHELKCKKFKTVFDNLEYHYTQMMSTFDDLSNEAKEITAIYKENV